jgi:hypothetical protein
MSFERNRRYVVKIRAVDKCGTQSLHVYGLRATDTPSPGDKTTMPCWVCGNTLPAKVIRVGPLPAKNETLTPRP